MVQVIKPEFLSFMQATILASNINNNGPKKALFVYISPYIRLEASMPRSFENQSAVALRLR